ncbi:GH-E family nuclease [Nocardia noduli]|uniref:GH-E family nuclease n=1 Tax=Nocardia noduli TaxID=2815722 RepID=UPI001C231631|nr:GH-E family nuclease [Nocardia noduli]
MAPPINVDPNGFTNAATEYERVHNTLVDSATRFSNRLAANSAACAGSDNAGLKWAQGYDEAAWSTVDAVGDLALAVGQMHDLLQFTAANHANANSQSGPDPKPGDLVFPAGTLKIYEPPEPPLAFGGDDPEPTGWSWVRGYVQGELWPNADVGDLRLTGAAWRDMASGLRIAAAMLPAARAMIESQQSTETGQALEQADLVKAEFDNLAGVCDNIGDSCYAYASAVEQTKSAVKRMLIEMVALVVADQTAGAIFAVFTGGGSELAAQGGMAILFAAYGARIATTIRALVGLVETVRVPAAVAQALARSSEALGPLLRARPALAEVGGAAAQGPFISFSRLRRPGLWVDTERQILANTKTWRKPGDNADNFYTVKSDPDVKVPIDKNYTKNPEITQLPKDPKGQYYLDSANGVRYPVNGQWDFGHNSGFENRRIIADAQSKGWTQEELTQYVNSHPEKFHVEDSTGNRSHRREKK